MKKIILSVFVTLFLVILFLSWGHTGNLKKARKIKISYFAGIEKKEILVEDGEEVKKMLAALEVESTESRGGNFFKPNCRIQFIRKDETYTEVFFQKPKHLHDPKEPRDYFLKNTKFYDLVNEIASKQAGRPIDVLRTTAMDILEGKLTPTSEIKVIYTIAGKKKEIIATAEEGQKLISAFATESREKTMTPPKKRIGLVRLISNVVPPSDFVFLTPKRIYTEQDGAPAEEYTLNNTKFYDLANELASKAEGKKIDVLKDN